MTTIVCNRQGMAADKRCTGVHVMRVTKIFRVNGSLIGFSGSLEQALKFVEWRRNPDQKPVFIGETNLQVLELTQSEEILLWGAEMVPIRVEEPFYAVGSGSPYALGAMAMGSDLKGAIKIAAKWDECTGTEVQTMTLKGK